MGVVSEAAEVGPAGAGGGGSIRAGGQGAVGAAEEGGQVDEGEGDDGGEEGVDEGAEGEEAEERSPRSRCGVVGLAGGCQRSASQ